MVSAQEVVSQGVAEVEVAEEAGQAVAMPVVLVSAVITAVLVALWVSVDSMIRKEM